MNPYLEQPELWHQVHNRLIVAIADDLTPQVAPQYLVAIEERTYQSVEDSLLVSIADVALTRRSPADPDPLGTLTVADRTAPTPVRVPLP